MKKKKLSLIVLFVLIIISIGIGVKVHMDNVEEQKQEIIQAEKLIAKHLIKEYQNINSIDFKRVTNNKDTGVFYYDVYINDTNQEFLFTYYNVNDFSESGSDKNMTHNFFNKRKEKVFNIKEEIKKIHVKYKLDVDGE